MITKRIMLFAIFIAATIVLLVPLTNAETVTSGTNLTNLSPNSTVSPAEPFITINPIGNHTLGEVFFINGTTNLPVSENLTMQIMYFDWVHRTHMKNEPNVPSPRYYAYLPYVSIIPDSIGTNWWSVNVTDAAEGLVAGRYEIEIFSEINSTCNRWGCPGSKSANVSDFILFPGNTSIIINYTPPQTQPPPTTLPLSSMNQQGTPLPWLLSITAIFAVMMILKFCHERN